MCADDTAELYAVQSVDMAFPEGLAVLDVLLQHVIGESGVAKLKRHGIVHAVACDLLDQQIVGLLGTAGFAEHGEFTVPGGARKMMGNVLPRDIKLSELKQTVGEPGDLIFCTYDNNVTRLAQYIYVSDEAAAEAEIASGWYALDGDGNPDVEGGTKDFTIPSGQGFVVNSLNSNAVLQFPKAM